MPFKMAFIGTHGVGKTTLAYGLAARLKRRDINLDVVVEVARRCPLPLNEGTTLEAQSWILHSQIANELAAESRSPVVICDRSVLDNYVYLLFARGRQPALEPLIESWCTTYDLQVYVPILRDSDAQPDGVRAVDPAFRRQIDDRLWNELEDRRIGVLVLDAERRGSWLDTVEEAVANQLRIPQLDLL
ncbi:MAG: ATP-binding protein [Holophagales bacterium]|nr:ATP-binding protein [Holophagales bacterium]